MSRPEDDAGRRRTGRGTAPSAGGSWAAPRAVLALGLGLVLLAVSLALSLGDATLPGAGLDPSWQLAAEFAARQHLVFGRDFVFTYGPYHYLSTRLFDPATFRLVLVYDAFAVAALFWFPLRNRSLGACLALALCLALPQETEGIRVAAMFAVFLVAVRERTAWGVLLVALCGPLVLAKYSYALVIAPLVLLADAERVWSRRAPVMTPALALAVLAADLAAGQPLGAVGALAANVLDIVSGYSRAMQLAGPVAELVLAVALGAAAIGFAARLAWGAREPAPGRDAEAPGARRADLAPTAAVLGLAWTLFVAFKMGFVRQDTHTLIFHEAAPLALAALYAVFDRPGSRARRLAPVFWLLVAGILASSLFWRSYLQRPSPQAPADVGAYAGRAAAGLKPRLETAVGWFTGEKFADLRQARANAEAGIRRGFPAAVTGAVDALPMDLSEIIVSRLDYRPRPVIQSYSAYTPRLQAQDRAHFEGAGAPDTLILRVEDIDGHLPTLAAGPSLPVIGQRYDPAGDDPLGLILKRRAAPRPMTRSLGPTHTVAIGAWTPVPGRPGRLLMAHIKVERSLLGRLAGFVLREPSLNISLRTPGGGDTTWRFVPDMAELGVAISPLPAGWDQVDALFDPASPSHAAPVVGLRLWSPTGNWAFRRATVAFEQIAYAPGFSGLMPPAPPPSPEMVALLQALGAPPTREAAATATGPALTPPVVADATLCIGAFDLLMPPDKASAPWQLYGWGWDMRRHAPFEAVILADDTGHVTGVLHARQPRPDVDAALKEVDTPLAGWSGKALRGQGRTAIAYGRLADGRACELGRKVWPQ
jgi:hypothetical protein